MVGQPNGMIVLAGGGHESFLARYDTEGLPDYSFGVGGKKVLLESIPFSGNHADAVLIQPDGKMLVSYKFGSWGGIFVYLARLTENGDWDATFGNQGILNADSYYLGDSIPNRFSSVSSLALQTDGKILATGTYAEILFPSPSKHAFALLRVTESGALDSTLGTNGLMVPEVGPGSHISKKLLLQPDGKILLAGNSTLPDGEQVITVARLQTDLPNATYLPTAGLALTIRPNPATNRITIEFDGDDFAGESRVRLTDFAGRTVMQQNITANSLDISALPPGTYILNTRINGRLAYGKFVKQ